MKGRLDEVGWVLDCFNDVVADFRVFYRIDSLDEIAAMGVEEFFALANRCVAYEGAVRWEFDQQMLDVQEELEQAEFGARLFQGGGEHTEIPVSGSYLYEALSKDEEMADA